LGDVKAMAIIGAEEVIEFRFFASALVRRKKRGTPHHGPPRLILLLHRERSVE
jgi:hypothetical protein